MSHVDDGRLHAFLDGALSAADPADAERVELHLAACADCRARHDEAARLRDDASALLGAAQPRAFVMPSFEAIRARSETVAPAQRVKRAPLFLKSPFSDFAWAAMFVLAIGLGWLLNDTMEGDDRAGPLQRPVASRGPADAGEDMRVFELPALESADREMAALSAAEETSGPPEVQEQGAAPATVGAAPPAAYDVVSDEDDAGAPMMELAAEEARAQPEEGRAEPTPAREAARTESLSQRAPAPAASPPVAAAPTGALADAAAGAGAASPELDDDGWRSVTLVEAQRLTGGQIVRLAGARILSSAARGAGSELEVRTVQLTDRGESIKVVQRRTPLLDARRRQSSAAEAEMAAPAEAERLEAERLVGDEVVAGLTVQLDAWTVTISGAVPPERLRELATGLS